MGPVGKLFIDENELNIIHFDVYRELIIYMNGIGVESINIIVLSDTFIIEDFSC